MTRVLDRFSRDNRAITAGTIFVILVIAGLVVLPVVASAVALRQNAHIRDVVEPFDQDVRQIGLLVPAMNSSFLRYVITAEANDLAAYKAGAQDLQTLLPAAQMRAQRLSPAAAAQMSQLEQTISRWEQFTGTVIDLKQSGLSDQATAAIATGQDTQLLSATEQQVTALRNDVAAVRASERSQLDSTLTVEAILAAVLAALGIPAAALVFGLSRRTTHLYKEVEIERGLVTEMAESERRRANELDAVIENLAEGVTVADQMGRIVHLNRVARQMWQLTWPEGRYLHVDELSRLNLRYPNGQPVPIEEFPLCQALRGETFYGIEVIYISPNGGRHHLKFGGSAVRDEHGAVVLAVTVFDDITPIRDLERQREEFISVVAHDLRGAVTVIGGYADLLNRLIRREDVPPRAQGAAKAIAAANRRLELMIGDLLDVSRLEAHRLALHKTQIDIVAAVREAAREAAELTKDHTVRVEAEGGIPPVEADADRLAQVLTNLLSNAVKYSYPSSEILVQVEARPEEVMVSVVDRGEGIAPEDIPKLFTRFYRTEAATREAVPGLGLGLYIAKGLVEAHGGRIWVESEPGRYTTFHFTLPADGRSEASEQR